MTNNPNVTGGADTVAVLWYLLRCLHGYVGCPSSIVAQRLKTSIADLTRKHRERGGAAPATACRNVEPNDAARVTHRGINDGT